MPWPKTGEIHYQAQLGSQNKGRAKIGFSDSRDIS